MNWLEINGRASSDTELNTGGLQIVTTLDPDIQNSAQNKLFGSDPGELADDRLLPVVDPKTGDVLAMATSKTYGTNT